jgi:glucose/arabinose dehydrogenase
MRPLLAIFATLAALSVAACAGSEEEGGMPADPAVTTEPETAPPAPPSPTTTQSETSLRLRLVEVASGLEAPVHLAAPASEPDRLYVVEQDGRIRVIEDGRVRDEPFLDIADQVQSGGEQGLLSVAFHPDYEANRRLYVDYTDVNGDTRVVEYRANGARTAVDEGTGRELLAVDQPYSNHNGGQLAFGPDGLLYVGMGDGGSGGDPENRAQDLSDRLGKLLRLDVDADGADWEIAAYGLRNPWRFSFDRESGDLYLGDVGQGSFEEVDYLPASSRGLVNFGWDVYEGRAVYEDKEPNGAGRLVMPIQVYPLEGANCSVVGGFVYRGEAMPALRGRYFYGDYCAGTVWSFRVRDGKATGMRRERFEVDGLTSFGEDARGELYLVSHGGSIFRLASQ